MKKSMFRALMVTFLSLSLIASSPAFALSQTISTDRIAGSDRVTTALSASGRGWDQADTVILNENENFSDAIAATPLAVKLNAPILLTKGTSLDGRVIAELERLQAKQVILLGGEARLGANIESKLDELKLSWERLGGKDRYATSVEIAKKLTPEATSVIMANGDNFPDALSAASYAGIEQMPILLTSAAKVSDTVTDYLQTLSPENLIVVGGEGVIPSKTLKNAGLAEDIRLGGEDRYGTNEQVNDYAKSAFSSTQTFLASGENYPDAIVGAVLASKYKAPLFLTPRNDLAPGIKKILTSGVKHISSTQKPFFLILGGTGVISANVESIIKQMTIPQESPLPQDGTSPPQEEPSTLPQEQTPPEPTPQEPTLPPQDSNLPQEETVKVLQGKTLIVDPGHGGENPGAVGPTGSKEEDNALAISQYLMEELKAAGANVVLTRTGDYSPAENNNPYNLTSDLKARVAIAKANNADLFVSVHNDSLNATSEGTSTYYSSSNPQSAQSKAIADLILTNVTSNLKTRNVGLFDKNFYVLRNTTMPAVLVEVAFISNPKEEALLKTAEFRQKAAKSIAAGIIQYYSSK